MWQVESERDSAPQFKTGPVQFYIPPTPCCPQLRKRKLRRAGRLGSLPGAPLPSWGPSPPKLGHV